MKKTTMTLCAARHTMPANAGKPIFEHELDPMDFTAMFWTAWNNIPEVHRLVVYATGLTAAMLAVVKVCENRKIDLIVMHYNRETGEYKPQPVLQFNRCWFCGELMESEEQSCSWCGAN